MSQKTAPTYNPPAPVMAATGTDLYNQGQQWYQQNQPGLYNAQSTALSNANNPDYYNQWGPTNLQQALGNQYFQNVWPDEQALIKQQMSQSGISSSPALAETLGRAYGGLQTQIGSYLSTQAQQEATNAINSGLGISQSSLLNPFVTTAGNQSNINTGYQNNYNQALAQQQYQQQMNAYNQSQSKGGIIGTLGTVGGTIAGGLIGGPIGAAAGGALGGGLGSLIGGGSGAGGSAFGGAANAYGQMAPLIFSGMSNGFGAAGSMPQGSSVAGGYSSLANGQNPYSGNGASSVYGPAQTSNVNPGSFQY